MSCSETRDSQSDRIVSVIVPLYKGRQYISKIEKMIRDALNYAGIYDRSELIFINDYPDDNIESFDSWYRIHNNRENLGIHASRVTGLEMTSGAYVHFLDQDDRIKREFYSSQLKMIGDDDVAVANAMLEHEGYSTPEYRNRFERQLVRMPLMYAMIGCRIESPGQCIIKRSSIPVSWKQDVLRNNGSDDTMLWLSMHAQKCRFAVSREVLYEHIHTGDNLSLDEDKILISLEETASKLLERYPDNMAIRILRKRVRYMTGNESNIIFKGLDEIRSMISKSRR